MFEAINNSTSAVRAFTRGVLVSAHNIANSSTSEFRPLRTLYESTAGGGVEANVQQASEETEGVDLAQETVDLIASQRAIEANLQVIRASEKTLGVLLDTIG